MDADILRKTKTVLEGFELDRTRLTFDATLREDLNLDTVEIMDLQAAVQEEFGVRIHDHEMNQIKTVADLMNFIEQRAP